MVHFVLSQVGLLVAQGIGVFHPLFAVTARGACLIVLFIVALIHLIARRGAGRFNDFVRFTCFVKHAQVFAVHNFYQIVGIVGIIGVPNRAVGINGVEQAALFRFFGAAHFHIGIVFEKAFGDVAAIVVSVVIRPHTLFQLEQDIFAKVYLRSVDGIRIAPYTTIGSNLYLSIFAAVNVHGHLVILGGFAANGTAPVPGCCNGSDLHIVLDVDHSVLHTAPGTNCTKDLIQNCIAFQVDRHIIAVTSANGQLAVSCAYLFYMCVVFDGNSRITIRAANCSSCIARCLLNGRIALDGHICCAFASHSTAANGCTAVRLCRHMDILGGTVSPFGADGHVCISGPNPSTAANARTYVRFCNHICMVTDNDSFSRTSRFIG